MDELKEKVRVLTIRNKDLESELLDLEIQVANLEVKNDRLRTEMMVGEWEFEITVAEKEGLRKRLEEVLREVTQLKKEKHQK